MRIRLTTILAGNIYYQDSPGKEKSSTSEELFLHIILLRTNEKMGPAVTQ